jgi:hypothetical protein
VTQGHAAWEGYDPILSVRGLQAEERPAWLNQRLQLRGVDADRTGVVIAEGGGCKRLGLGDVYASNPGAIHSSKVHKPASSIDNCDIHWDADCNGLKAGSVDHLCGKTQIDVDR